MKVSDYVPKLYNKNLEMNNIINSEEYEFENLLKPNVDNVFKNTFAISANEQGISNFEQILDIIPDTSTETLTERRERVVYRLTSHIPYTIEALIIRLDDILGVNNYTLTTDFQTNMTLQVTALRPGKFWYEELYQLLDQIVPCNIDWSITIYSATWELVNSNYTTWQDVYDTDMTWQELMDGEWV